MKKLKRLTQHEHVCDEVVWGSDNRFTKCRWCGKTRYYPHGYDGLHRSQDDRIIFTGSTGEDGR